MDLLLGVRQFVPVCVGCILFFFNALTYGMQGSGSYQASGMVQPSQVPISLPVKSGGPSKDLQSCVIYFPPILSPSSPVWLLPPLPSPWPSLLLHTYCSGRGLSCLQASTLAVLSLFIWEAIVSLLLDLCSNMHSFQGNIWVTPLLSPVPALFCPNPTHFQP